jgi:hypothetical protein
LGNITDPIDPTPAQAPIIDSQVPLANSTNNFFTNRIVNTTLSVTIDAFSAPPLYYQWYAGPAAIPGATNSSYATIETNGASYLCVITNFIGSVTSSPVYFAELSLPTLTPYQSAVFNYNPLAYWPLTETSGNTAYDYASTNDGTYKGTYTLGNPGVPFPAGFGANTSVGFDGSSAYVDIPVHNLNLTGPMTVIAWCQSPSGGEPNSFATVVGHSDSSYRISVVNNVPRFADSGPDIVGTKTAGDGNWHQIIGVYDGTNQLLYLDGQLTGVPLASTPSGSGDDVQIAQAPDYAGGRNFNGNIAEVAILGQALTAAQIVTVYNTLGQAPTVTVAPTAPSIYPGYTQKLTATAVGSTPITYKWYYIVAGGSTTNLIPGATSSTYTIPPVTVAQNGYQYGVIAINAVGAAAAAATLTVQDAAAFPVTDLYPGTAEAYAGAPVTYGVVAGGTLPIYYQWSMDGSPVAGATNATFASVAQCGPHTYQVTYTNALSAGSPVVSSVATLQGDAYPTNIMFNTNGTGWQLNTPGAVPTIATNVLTLTDGGSGEAASAFYTTAQYVGSFTASFTYSGVGGADGAAFIVQNDNPTILGGTGGGLGYSGISNSIALEFNLYPNNGEIPGIAAGTNGNTFASGGGAEYTPLNPIDISNDNPLAVKLNFANGILSVSVVDTITLAKFSANYAYGSLVPILNGNLGYVGFSGGDGGATSTQTISNFQFTSTILPEFLSVSPASNGSVTLSWSAADPNFQLLQATSLKGPWTAGPTATVANGVASATVSVAGTSARFYRLLWVTPCP